MASSHPPKILVVDDEVGARTALLELLREEGYQVRAAADAFKALGHLERWTPDLIITDVRMPGMTGIELMKKVRERLPAVGVIIMTAYGSVQNAVEAMRAGADDYITKPLHFPALVLLVGRVLEHQKLRRENERLRSAFGSDDGAGVGFVARSKASRNLLQLVQQIAGASSAILITGSSGSGKELVARAIHNLSPRKDAPFVCVRCGGLSESALDEELFGAPGHAGRVPEADGGTLFLDDLGGLPAALQVKLLRLVRERDFEAPGSDGPHPADVRVIGASEHDVVEDVEAGTFREDLYYSLNVVSLRVPRLRQRREDLPVLAMHFLRKFAPDGSIRGFSDRALGVLVTYDWPGNVRQLENFVERAVTLCDGIEIEPKHLPRELMEPQRHHEQPQIPGTSLAELEKYAILKTLEHVGGSTSKAARILGISPRKIQYRLSEYREVDPEGTPQPGKGGHPKGKKRNSGPS